MYQGHIKHAEVMLTTSARFVEQDLSPASLPAGQVDAGGA